MSPFLLRNTLLSWDSSIVNPLCLYFDNRSMYLYFCSTVSEIITKFYFQNEMKTILGYFESPAKDEILDGLIYKDYFWHHNLVGAIDDKEIALALCHGNGMGYRLLSTNLQNDKDIALVACNQNLNVYQLLSHTKLGQDGNILETVLSQDQCVTMGFTLENAELLTDERFLLTDFLTDSEPKINQIVNIKLKSKSEAALYA